MRRWVSAPLVLGGLFVVFVFVFVFVFVQGPRPWQARAASASPGDSKPTLAGRGSRPAGAGPNASPEHREKRDRLRREVMDHMRTVRMWKLTEELKLDQATAAKVFPLLAKFDDRAREIGRERHELRLSLWKELRAEKPDDARINGLIDRLTANRARRPTLEEERWNALRQVLTPVQQAKLTMLLPQLEEGFRRRIRDAFEEQHRGPNGGRAKADRRYGEPPPGDRVP
jgi:Spy/CpxP family protein refolding chaperone